jgi:hypothetical protein
MKLPMHTTSRPVTGTETRRVLRAIEAGRAATNPRAKAFAAEIVAALPPGADAALLAGADHATAQESRIR